VSHRNRNASPLAALQQAERLLGARLTGIAETLDHESKATDWEGYAHLAQALAVVMGYTRGWPQRGPYGRTGPAPR
jgi:hypothetical protein